jgi:hypothetical protein
MFCNFVKPYSALSKKEETTSESIKLLLRREFVHKLAAGASSFSQLQECLSNIGSTDNYNKVNPNDINELVTEISIARDSSAHEAPKRFLKPEYWSEYDPSFYHLPFSAHQIAIENRPKVMYGSSLMLFIYIVSLSLPRFNLLSESRCRVINRSSDLERSFSSLPL